MNYATVSNSSDLPVSFRVTYFLNGRLVSKSTSKFYKCQFGQLELPLNAVGVAVTILAFYPHSSEVIYQDTLEESENACYRVTGNIRNIFCKKIPCHNVIFNCKKDIYY